MEFLDPATAVRLTPAGLGSRVQTKTQKIAAMAVFFVFVGNLSKQKQLAGLQHGTFYSDGSSVALFFNQSLRASDFAYMLRVSVLRTNVRQAGSLSGLVLE